MNLLVNPGFDDAPDFVGWTKTASGVALNATTGRSLPNCAELTATYLQISPPPNPSYLNVEGAVDQDVDMFDGRAYVISAWVRTDAPWGPIALIVAGTEIARLDTDTAGAWVYLGGTYLATATGPHGVAIKALRGAGQGYGLWSVDDCEIEEVWEGSMARGSYIAYKALFDAVRGINGQAGGFWTHLGGRVYPALVLPEQLGQNALPYACLPLMKKQSQPEAEGRHIFDTLRQQVVIFVPGNNLSMDPDTSTVRAALNAYNDLQMVAIPAADGTCWYPTEAVQDAKIVEKDFEAGLPDGTGYATATFELTYVYSRENLGPGGA